MSDKVLTERIKQYCSNGCIILDDDKGNIDFDSLSKIMTKMKSSTNIEEQIKQISIAANHGNTGAMFKLSRLYEKQHDIDNMLKYLKMASDNDFIDATIILVNYYKSCINYEEIAKYNEILFKQGHVELAEELGVIYEHLKIYPKMIKYYEIAIHHRNQNALRSMILYYSKNKHMNIDKLLEYFHLAVELKDPASMHALAIYYDEFKDTDSAQKYFNLALEFENDRIKTNTPSSSSETTNQPNWTNNSRSRNYCRTSEKEDTLCKYSCAIL